MQYTEAFCFIVLRWRRVVHYGDWQGAFYQKNMLAKAIPNSAMKSVVYHGLPGIVQIAANAAIYGAVVFQDNERRTQTLRSSSMK